MTLQKYFFTSKFSYALFFFATPPIKVKLGQQIGGGLLIANHLDQSLWWANQKYWVAVRSYLLHSFTSRGNMSNYAEPKPYSWAKLASIGCSSLNFTVQITYPALLEMLKINHLLMNIVTLRWESSSHNKCVPWLEPSLSELYNCSSS